MQAKQEEMCVSVQVQTADQAHYVHYNLLLFFSSAQLSVLLGINNISFLHLQLVGHKIQSMFQLKLLC